MFLNLNLLTKKEKSLFFTDGFFEGSMLIKNYLNLLTNIKDYLNLLTNIKKKIPLRKEIVKKVILICKHKIILRLVMFSLLTNYLNLLTCLQIKIRSILICLQIKFQGDFSG